MSAKKKTCSIQKNVGKADRIIRFFISVVLIYLGYAYYNQYSIIFFVLASLLLLTVMTGFCGPYKLLKISTVRKKRR